MPRYEHDCDACVYLGEYAPPSCQERYKVAVLDLYFCPGGDATVIARYGSEGGEYSSGLVFALQALKRGEYDQPLYEAFCRAQQLGLDVLGNMSVEYADWR